MNLYNPKKRKRNWKRRRTSASCLAAIKKSAMTVCEKCGHKCKMAQMEKHQRHCFKKSLAIFYRFYDSLPNNPVPVTRLFPTLMARAYQGETE